MRLDVFLCEGGFAASRTEAKGLIQSEKVEINGKKVTKPAFEVNGDEDITVDRSDVKFVSRGGVKLEAALLGFDIDVSNRLCIDVGASSGGFTDCLLQRGAASVIAVDSGYGQLVQRLRDDPRVTVVENYNARYMSPEDFDIVPDFAVMDVSFISVTLILPALVRCLSDAAKFVCLIKPQFEVGKQGLGKGGIVKNDKLRQDAVDKVVSSAASVGLKCLGIMTSPIKGGDGNTEFLGYFVKESN